MLPMEGGENDFLRLRAEDKSTLLTETTGQVQKTKKAERLFESSRFASDLKGQFRGCGYKNI